MDRPVRIFLMVLGLAALNAKAQTTVVMGTVTDAVDRKGLLGAGVRSVKEGRAVIADAKGKYIIQVSPGSNLEFSCLGYTAILKALSNPSKKDTVILNISLARKAYELPLVNVSAEPKVDTVIGNWRFYVEDYEFFGDKYILLTWEKRLSKSKLMLADGEQKIISSVAVIGEAQSLYKDFLGRIYVKCREGVQRVSIGADNSLALISIDEKEFNTLIEPCIDTIRENLYFSTYRGDMPRFDYYAYDRKADTFRIISHITDAPLERMHNFEYEFLKPADKVLARKMARDYHMDKRDVAAAMTGFAQTHYFTPLYAPLFVIHDTVHVFDHYRNTLYKYDRSHHLVDSVSVDYHHPKNWREWKRKLIKDEAEGTVYALFQKEGYYYLKRIDTGTGKVVATYKLSYRYLDRIRIKNSQAYYVYRPFESLQTKYLYREPLPAN